MYSTGLGAGQPPQPYPGHPNHPPSTAHPHNPYSNTMFGGHAPSSSTLGGPSLYGLPPPFPSSNHPIGFPTSGLSHSTMSPAVYNNHSADVMHHHPPPSFPGLKHAPQPAPGTIPHAHAPIDGVKVEDLVVELLDPKSRDQALLELSKKREQYDDLALILWHSFGVMTILIQDIISVYPLLSPPTLSSNASNRVCNALALLQCVASHSETRGLFLNAHIPLFLYPFLNTTSKNRPFEYLRLTSLGVIGALVKNDSTDVITYLLSTEIIPLCLRIMETGSELSKIVAIFILQKILIDPIGLSYICQTYERFYAVGTVLANMVTQLVESQSVRLLKHVIRCYLRLSDNPRAREALRQCLPEPLRGNTFASVLKDDTVSKRCLGQLLINLSDPQFMVQDSRQVIVQDSRGTGLA